MSQSSDAFTVPDGSGASVRAALNADLQALATLSSGATAPSSTFAGMFWFDTANKLVKIRNSTNDAWVTLFKIDTGDPAKGVPPGTGSDYWGTVLPDGYLWCYGQAVSRTTYAALFSAIGTTFGAGDGSTTFNLPDKRGRMSIGKDDMGGTAANRVTNAISGVDGTVLGAAGGSESMQDHDHIQHSGDLITQGTGVTSGRTADGADAGPTSIHTSSTGAGGSENLPPGIVCNYIIKT